MTTLAELTVGVLEVRIVLVMVDTLVEMDVAVDTLVEVDTLVAVDTLVSVDTLVAVETLVTVDALPVEVAVEVVVETDVDVTVLIPLSRGNRPQLLQRRRLSRPEQLQQPCQLRTLFSFKQCGCR